MLAIGTMDPSAEEAIANEPKKIGLNTQGGMKDDRGFTSQVHQNS